MLKPNAMNPFIKKTFAIIFIAFSFTQLNAQTPKKLELLFLGHASKHHNSDVLASIMSKEYFKKGINITYTSNINDLNEKTLKPYDGLILYANYDTISASHATALLNFVKNGKGFIPIHCASYCFRNNPEVVELIGGQFKEHGYDSFPSVFKDYNHPLIKNITPFYTKDETYTHTLLSKNITVLTERKDGNKKEPYTWIQNVGKGKVFYTAYGHDDITFNNPQFLKLVENGILWAVNDNAVASLKAYTIATPTYTEAIIPNYEKRNPVPKYQGALTPAQSQSLIQIPVGFDLQLFASEPLIINPIYINWDEKGRLWAIETVDYPNEVRENKEGGQDKIVILEDTDHDGKADKSTVFADKLNIPTSFTFSDGGIVVAQAPYFLFLKDTDGDDKANIKDTILSGWGISDTHAGPSNLRYGLDNKLWGTVGYSGFVNAKGKDTTEFSMGIYSFKPTTKKVNDIEFLGGTTNNTWGLGFTEEFDVFASTANNTHSVFFGVPKRVLKNGYAEKLGTEKIDAHYAMHVVTKNLRQVDVFGGFTAAAGQSIYTARNYPSEFWNKVALVCEPTGRLIHKNFIEQVGSGFKEKGDGWNLVASADEWFGPIQSEVGPDGNVWITDWYDFIIQHNPTPKGFDNGKGNAHINPLRDHERGRIYRLVYKDGAVNAPISLDKNDKAGLLKALRNNNMFWRTTAQRLLVENKDPSVAPDLINIINTSNVDAAGVNAPAIHALWTLHGLGLLKNNVSAVTAATKALNNASGGVRKAAVEVLKESPTALKAYQNAKVFEDTDYRVRLAAVIAIADMKPSTEAYTILNKMLLVKENTDDKWINLALRSARGAHIKMSKEKNAVATIIDQTINISVIKNQMKYDLTEFTVKAGSTIKINFINVDYMQHNLLILRPGSKERVGAAADKIAMDPNGAELNYIPKMYEVLHATPLVNPQKTFSMTINVPDNVGDYPYICSFPGHWRIMNGVMKVIAK
jgi:putative membrane-bound dehydrogenase-like protein